MGWNGPASLDIGRRGPITVPSKGRTEKGGATVLAPLRNPPALPVFDSCALSERIFIMRLLTRPGLLI